MKTEAERIGKYMVRPILALDRLSFMECASQVMVRCYGLSASAHRGKVRKAGRKGFPLEIVEQEVRRIPSKGWAELIRKVYEVDPLVCPRCGGRMRVVAFLTEPAVVDRIVTWS